MILSTIGALSQHFSNMRAPGITYQSTDSVQTGDQFHPKSFSLFIKLCFCPVIHEAPSPETQQCPFHTSKAQNNFLCHRWAWYRRIDEMQSQTNVIKQFMGILNPDLLPHTRSCFVKCVPCVAPWQLPKITDHSIRWKSTSTHPLNTRLTRRLTRGLISCFLLEVYGVFNVLH